jgi:hypothetical protein
MFPLLNLALEFFCSLLRTQLATSFIRHASLSIRRATAFICSVSRLLLFAVVCYSTAIMDCMCYAARDPLLPPAFASSAAPNCYNLTILTVITSIGILIQHPSLRWLIVYLARLVFELAKYLCVSVVILVKYLCDSVIRDPVSSVISLVKYFYDSVIGLVKCMIDLVKCLTDLDTGLVKCLIDLVADLAKCLIGLVKVSGLFSPLYQQPTDQRIHLAVCGQARRIYRSWSRLGRSWSRLGRSWSRLRFRQVPGS